MGTSAAAHSFCKRFSGLTQSEAKCSFKVRLPLITVDSYTCIVIEKEEYSCSTVQRNFPTAIVVSNSSCISRARVCCCVSPGSIFPPGNSHLYFVSFNVLPGFGPGRFAQNISVFPLC